MKQILYVIDRAEYNSIVTCTTYLFIVLIIVLHVLLLSHVWESIVMYSTSYTGLGGVAFP